MKLQNCYGNVSYISVRGFENWCDENGLEKNPETVRPEQLGKVLERFFACMVNKTDPMTIVSVTCHP